jgi:hypothetical protein
MSDNTYWIYDYKILLKYWKHVTPHHSYTMVKNMNSLTRLLIYAYICCILLNTCTHHDCSCSFILICILLVTLFGIFITHSKNEPFENENKNEDGDICNNIIINENLKRPLQSINDNYYVNQDISDSYKLNRTHNNSANFNKFCYHGNDTCKMQYMYCH